ncbi:hypothetical protein [Frigoribacterium salinisoli]
MTLLGPAGPRLRTVLAGALAAQAVLLGVLVVVLDRDLVLPATLDVTGDGPRRAVASLHVGWAVVVAVALTAAALAATVRPRVAGRADTVERLAASVPWAVVVFLVAVLDGVRDVGTLVLVYAATTVVQLAALVQDRVVQDRLVRGSLVPGSPGAGGAGQEARAGSGLLPLTVASGIGIVPWGVVALHQVGAGVAGSPPSGTVRVVTLVVLGCAIAAFVAEWRAAARALREGQEGRPAPAAPGRARSAPGPIGRAPVPPGAVADPAGPEGATRASCPRAPRTPAAAVVLLAIAASALAWAGVLGAS